MPLTLPLAELEVGKHLYWQLGNLKIHGQVFLSSWVVIGALLALVVVGTRKLERDPRGTQNLLGCIRTSMGTLGARTLKEMREVEVVVAPSLLTEGKVYQKAQQLGMGK